MSLLSLLHGIYFHSALMPMQLPELWLNTKLHNKVLVDIYTSSLLLRSRCIRSSLVSATGVSQRECLSSSTSHASSCSTVYRISTVAPITGIFTESLENGNQREKVTHSQPLPVGKQETPRFSGTQRPTILKCANNYSRNFSILYCQTLYLQASAQWCSASLEIISRWRAGDFILLTKSFNLKKYLGFN